MRNGEPDAVLPPEVDARLNDLLEQWAGRRRLTRAQAGAIRLAILEPSPELGYEWWQDLLGRVVSVVTQRASGFGYAAGLQAAYASATQHGPGWPSTSDVAGYRPYLRLA